MFPEAVDDEAQRRALQPPCGDSFQMAELLEDGGCCVPASQSVYHPACSGRVSGGTVEIRLNVGETVLNASESDLLEGCAESFPAGIQGQTSAAMASPSLSGSVATTTFVACEIALRSAAMRASPEASRGTSSSAANVLRLMQAPRFIGGRSRIWPHVAMTVYG